MSHWFVYGILLLLQLSQNYPNPFNPWTTIRYAVPIRTYVTIAVYNVLGERVAVLMDGQMEAGHHEVTLDARDRASGVYFYRLSTGNYVQTRKMVLVH